MPSEGPALTPAQEIVDRVLVDARNLLDRPSRWTQGATARDRTGRWVAAAEDDACQWSIDGALWMVAPTVADAALAGMCVRKLLGLDVENPCALWAWGDMPGRKLDDVRQVLHRARTQVADVVHGRTLSMTRAIHVPVPVPRR